MKKKNPILAKIFCYFVSFFPFIKEFMELDVVMPLREPPKWGLTSLVGLVSLILRYADSSAVLRKAMEFN